MFSRFRYGLVFVFSFAALGGYACIVIFFLRLHGLIGKVPRNLVE